MKGKQESARHMGWLREAISDTDGIADAAYVSILWALAGALASVGFICLMAAISYFRCYAIADVGEGVRAQVPCSFDPQPVGIAIGAILTAFAAAIGALAGYMAATRRAASNRAQDDPPSCGKRGKS